MKPWPMMPLGDLCIAKSGNSKIIKGTLKTINDGNLFPAYSATGQDVFSDHYDFDGDGIVISAVGARCGKCFLASGKWRAIANTHVILPKPEKVKVRFLWYLLNDEAFWIKGGTAQPFVKVLDSLKKRIAVPPLQVQERIVKLLDEADKLQKLRAEADRRTDALVPALFHDMFFEGRARISPDIRLEHVAEVVSGVAKGRKFNGTKPIEVLYLRVANVQAGHLDLTEIKTILALPSEAKELALQRGDVLLTEGGDFDKLGRGAMLEKDMPDCIHQNHVFRVRVNRAKLEPIYFAKFLLTPEARAYFLSCAKRTTNLASINMRQLRALPIPVPPLPLQQEFSDRVREIQGLEGEQVASRMRLDGLFKSMRHRAFTGEL
jgi:type I restriction enzyme S subunit